MKRTLTATLLLSFVGICTADDVTNSDRMLCSSAEVVACFEGSDCVAALPWELDVPQFVIVDLDEKNISTTAASGENRSTTFSSLHTDDTVIQFQGIERGRAFSFTIDKKTGLLTVAVSRDGITVSVFGACTDADI